MLFVRDSNDHRNNQAKVAPETHTWQCKDDSAEWPGVTGNVSGSTTTFGTHNLWTAYECQ